MEGMKEGKRREEGGKEEKEEQKWGELGRAQLQVYHGVSPGGAQAVVFKEH